MSSSDSEEEDKLLLALEERKFDSTPAPFKFNESELDRYIYPLNVPARKYQEHITRTALFANTLVALPTGTGKTFIASTVMLNWYRWTTSAKVIFMAPTRPLVSQQLGACLGISGIPRDAASVMMGKLGKNQREYLWQTKRMFFATPQTVQNDLSSGVLDATEIACLVIDEAHRATGNASYVAVVDHVYVRNPACRIVALTATPSRYIEGAEDVVRNLRVAALEMRTDNDPEIAQYLHEREVIREVIDLEGTDVESAMEKFTQTFKEDFDKFREMKVLRVFDPTSLTLMSARDAQQRLNMILKQQPASGSSNDRQKFALYIKSLKLIQAGHLMRLLKIHGIAPFVNAMCDLQNETSGKHKLLKSYVMSRDFQDCKNFCLNLLANRDYRGHPKLDKLVEIMNERFAEDPNCRAIIFSEFRHSAQEITRVLEVSCPAVKARMFFGQAAGKGKTGMSQKDQEKAIEELRRGKTVNTIVATSIGEEGLDIGQVDLIICYDQGKSPIRTIQRMGRTGRKRNGRVYFLLTAKEEDSLDLALKGYETIQESMKSNENLELSPVNRIIPANYNPVCEAKVVEIPEENHVVLESEDVVANFSNMQTQELSSYAVKKRRRASTTKTQHETGSKVPRAKKIKTFTMPPDAIQGFRTASEVLLSEQESADQKQN